MFPAAISKSLAACILLVSLYACYWAARIGYADSLARDISPQTTAAAIRLAPANAAYYAQLAQSDPPHSRVPIQTALALNPSSSSLYLNFAELAEQQQDLPRAHAYLLRAVALDRTFGPRWLLAEFYARTHDPARFWPAIQAAFAASYDDVTPLFDLCRQMTPHPETIFALAIPPTRPDVARQYLDFLLSKSQTALAVPVALSLLHHPTPDSTASLLAFITQSLAAALPTAPALTVWNTLAQSHLIDYPALQPAQARSLTNPDFRHPFLSQAFDWRLSHPPQIFISQPDSLRFEFSGNQPEQCDLLAQYLPLEPSRAYRLTVRYFTRGLNPDPNGDTGLLWQLRAPSAPLDLHPAAPLPTADSPRSQLFTFTTTPQTNTAELQLSYRRSLGTVRREGVFYLQSVTLEFAP